MHSPSIYLYCSQQERERESRFRSTRLKKNVMNEIDIALTLESSKSAMFPLPSNLGTIVLLPPEEGSVEGGSGRPRFSLCQIFCAFPSFPPSLPRSLPEMKRRSTSFPLPLPLLSTAIMVNIKRRRVKNRWEKLKRP